MINKNYLLFLIFFSLFFYSQTQFQGDFRIKNEKPLISHLGYSQLNVYYRVSFSPNKKNVSQKREAVTLLQISNKFSKYTDEKILKKDSLYNRFRNLDYLTGKEVNELFKFKESWSSTLYKDFENKKVIVQDRLRNLYQYEEINPDLRWEIKKETRIIIGYKCQKAVLNFRGRNYSAWYALDIPKNNGPYIFGGLPGLILEIEDEQKEFLFTAIAINNIPQEVYYKEERGMFKVSRDKFREVQFSYFNNPGFFHGRAYNEDGTPLVIKSTPIPYNLIELE